MLIFRSWLIRKPTDDLIRASFEFLSYNWSVPFQLNHEQHQLLSWYRKCIFIILDPCVARPCQAPYAVCKAVRDRAQCSCKENCPRIDNPVCGSNYKTYRNKCLMELEACQSGTMIRARSNGRCPGEPVKITTVILLFAWKVVFLIFLVLLQCINLSRSFFF